MCAHEIGAVECCTVICHLSGGNCLLLLLLARLPCCTDDLHFNSAEANISDNMKSRFTSADIVAAVNELQNLVGMRVVQVYDVDSKTYLFKLNRQEEKTVLLFESGIRIHTTEYEWPKGSAPSTFSMKLRKHLSNKRIEHIRQLGVDRIVNIQFGINEATYHVIIEMYDRGNVVLTDGNYVILNILRPRQAGAEDVRLAVREKYPVFALTQAIPILELSDVRGWLENAQEGNSLKKVILPKVFCGPAILDHCLQSRDITVNTKIKKGFITDDLVKRIHEAILEGHEMLENFKRPGTTSGIITLKVEKRFQPTEDGSTEIISYNEFHPFPFKSLVNQRTENFKSFLQAVDTFFSRQEQQKISLKAHNLEKEAVKKLENIKIDHEKRVSALETAQKMDVEKAKLIQNNLELVEKALFAVRSAIASQRSWDDIGDMIKEAQLQGDPVAESIKELHLDRNHFLMYLSDPFNEDEAAAVVDIDIDLSAYANATKYFEKKKQAAKKQEKTLQSSAKALKSAQKKTTEMLKQVELTTNIARARKTYWFEKFYWFISSENYLVIGGRDALQNEVIVKKYLNKGDVYVHADLHGASSIVIKNPSGEPIPPKTLNEAGTMAICYSAAWEAKVVTTAWWVYQDQVSKRAPTGEYLSQGSFMVRGKKNFLPPLYLIMGFGFMFRLDEESIPRHAEDRKARLADDNLPVMDDVSVTDDIESHDQNEIAVSSSEDEDEGSAFPDTQVQVLQPVAPGKLLQSTQKPENEEVVVYSQPVKKKTIVKAANKKKDKGQQKKPPQQQTADGQQAVSQKKKMSKAKQRKIKQRYGDQDEEERQLKMKLLASAGKHNETSAVTKNTTTDEKSFKNMPSAEEFLGGDETDGTRVNAREWDPQRHKGEIKATEEANKESEKDNDADDEGATDDTDDDASPTDDFTAILNSLTGVPVEDDVLLYAVPICAPYSTIINYKYKVKLTPGINKRGKAAKIALNMFQHDKSSTQREKDLLRAAKDQDVARNMPGRVKMSAANLQKYKK
ncbi:nuclear export mediator factor NEMF homolog [Varroa jacobsoni]|uniref:nuclear export mediator factor NEMF homolog n=1 Tax=Varroa jacobsoni TaxID=62625 RepID=UPI000BF428BE|nr:nuclear export mediator factor NEMF homolog [Varroa jacobsoni]